MNTTPNHTCTALGLIRHLEWPLKDGRVMLAPVKLRKTSKLGDLAAPLTDERGMLIFALPGRPGGEWVSGIHVSRVSAGMA